MTHHWERTFLKDAHLQRTKVYNGRRLYQYNKDEFRHKF